MFFVAGSQVTYAEAQVTPSSVVCTVDHHSKTRSKVIPTGPGGLDLDLLVLMTTTSLSTRQHVFFLRDAALIDPEILQWRAA